MSESDPDHHTPTRGHPHEFRSRDAYGLVEIEISGQELYLLRGGFTGLADRIDDQDLDIRIGVERHRMQSVVDDLDEIWSGLDDAESKTFVPGSGERWIHDPTDPSGRWTTRAATPEVA